MRFSTVAIVSRYLDMGVTSPVITAVIDYRNTPCIPANQNEVN